MARGESVAFLGAGGARELTSAMPLRSFGFLTDLYVVSGSPCPPRGE